MDSVGEHRATGACEAETRKKCGLTRDDMCWAWQSNASKAMLIELIEALGRVYVCRRRISTTRRQHGIGSHRFNAL
jgi:hypothetical protein